jgi:hypothetical protein
VCGFDNRNKKKRKRKEDPPLASQGPIFLPIKQNHKHHPYFFFFECRMEENSDDPYDGNSDNGLEYEDPDDPVVELRKAQFLEVYIKEHCQQIDMPRDEEESWNPCK